MNNLFGCLTKKDKMLWIASLTVVTASNTASGDPDPLTLIAALIGVTSLIFAAKGNPWSQIMIIVFSILYGIISWRFRYWGEVVTYMGMTLPMAVWSAYTWFRNPSKGSGNVVAVRSRLTERHMELLTLFTVTVTTLFYFILRILDTPNLLFSTLSVSTSFAAASLTMLRSPYYAVWYGLNDLVLIVLWVLASAEDISYIPVAVNFVIFFINDIYGFVNWRRRERALKE